MPSEIIGAYDSITISGGSLNLLRGKEAGGSCRAFGGDKVRIIGGTIQRDESIYIYDALDAYANRLDSFTLENLPENAGKLHIEIEVMKETEAQDAFWKSFSRIASEKDQEIQRLHRQIHEMENTKAWKLYRSIKKK